MTIAPSSPSSAIDDQRILATTLDRLIAVEASVERLRSDNATWSGPAHRLYLLHLERVNSAVTAASENVRAALDASRLAAGE